MDEDLSDEEDSFSFDDGEFSDISGMDDDDDDDDMDGMDGMDDGDDMDDGDPSDTQMDDSLEEDEEMFDSDQGFNMSYLLKYHYYY